MTEYIFYTTEGFTQAPDGKYRTKVAEGTYPGALRDLYADKEAYRIAFEERVG